MNTLKFVTSINAPSSRVWEVLWNNKTYRDWTSAFTPGSHAESDWKQGSRIRFLDGQGSGMYSEIEQLKPNERMSFRHLGVIKKNEEQPQDEQSKAWSGAKEIYSLSESNGTTELTVEVDSNEDFAGYLQKTFPLALAKVKELSESR